MIYIKQGGRTGNQLFNYAFARKLQLSYPDEELTFDYSFIEKMNETHSHEGYWEDCLVHFNTAPYHVITDQKDIVFVYGSLRQKIVYWIWRIVHHFVKTKKMSTRISARRKLFPFTARAGVYYLYSTFSGYVPYKLAKTKNKFVLGAFEERHWFDDIRETLLKELAPKKPIKESNLELLSAIKSSNAVCVSVRKWSIDETGDRLADREICGQTYFENAIRKMAELVENPTFVVFSDDVEWGKDMVKKILGDVPVLSETGKDDVAEKLALMSSCKHFILSNSTFSWWAQYLSTNEKKIVISPDHWFNEYEEKLPLIEDNWILVKCE